MFDHTGITVRDLRESKRFYAALFEPLAIGLLMEFLAEQTGGNNVEAVCHHAQ